MQPFTRPYWFAPLDTALQLANLNPDTLLAGAAAAFRWGKQTYAVPASAAPLAVAYRPDVFKAALLPPPAPDWTVQDFETACARISGLARAGRLPGCSGAFPSGIVASMWYAFALGYGGAIATNGRFDLTGADTLLGLAKLVQLVRDYMIPPRDLSRGTAVIEFVPYTGPASLPAGRHVARFPRLPVRPVQPVTLSGWGVVYVPQSGQPVPAPDPAAENAVVQFCLWLYQAARHDPAAASAPPVLTDPAVQRGYWQSAAQVAVGADALAYSTDYIYPGAGLPESGDSFDDSGIVGALADAVQGAASVDLPTALAAAAGQLDADVARYALDKAMRVREETMQGSAGTAFGAPRAFSPQGPVRRVCVPPSSASGTS